MGFACEDLSEDQFESRIVLLCQRLLGISVRGFANGPDGGRDAKFLGTAKLHPRVNIPRQSPERGPYFLMDTGSEFGWHKATQVCGREFSEDAASQRTLKLPARRIVRSRSAYRVPQFRIPAGAWLRAAPDGALQRDRASSAIACGFAGCHPEDALSMPPAGQACRTCHLERAARQRWADPRFRGVSRRRNRAGAGRFNSTLACRVAVPPRPAVSARFYRAACAATGIIHCR